jgi:hypothetical protein
LGLRAAPPSGAGRADSGGGDGALSAATAAAACALLPGPVSSPTHAASALQDASVTRAARNGEVQVEFNIKPVLRRLRSSR